MIYEVTELFFKTELSKIKLTIKPIALQDLKLFCEYLHLHFPKKNITNLYNNWKYEMILNQTSH
jgi:hypothetical protein